MEALGRILDISTGFAPVDLATAGATGMRCGLARAASALVLVELGVAAAGADNVVFTLQEHTAPSAGTSQNLAIIDKYWVKAEATLDGDETWSEVTQAAAATLTLLGATYATQQVLLAFEVDGVQLSAGFDYFSVSAADPGINARLGACSYLLNSLAEQAKPARLRAPLS